MCISCYIVYLKRSQSFICVVNAFENYIISYYVFFRIKTLHNFRVYRCFKYIELLRLMLFITKTKSKIVVKHYLKLKNNVNFVLPYVLYAVKMALYNYVYKFILLS